MDAHTSESGSSVGVGVGSCVGVHVANLSLHNLCCNRRIRHMGEEGRNP